MIDDALILSELLLRGELNHHQLQRSLSKHRGEDLTRSLIRQGLARVDAVQAASLELGKQGLPLALQGRKLSSTVLGGFRLERTLGVGGAAVVFAAQDPQGRPLALKLMRESDPQKLARFERERRLQTLFTEDEGFVPCLGTGASPWGPYLIMPRMSGDLASRLEDEPFEIEDAASLICELAQAIGRAHARGVVHRDLKPANILFDGRGRPLIADLGLAKHFCRDSGEEGAESLTLTRGPGGRGTPGYMAPEQLDSGAVGPQADVFALGVVLYELLAGRPPFLRSNIVAMLAAATAGAYTRLRELRPDCPRWLERVVDRCLRPEPAQRYPDGRALAEALTRSQAPRWPLALLGVLLLGLSGASFALWPGPPAAPPAPPSKPSAPAKPPAPKPEPPPAESADPRPAMYRGLDADPWRLAEVWGNPQGRHGAMIATVRVDPRGGRILSCALDGSARLWDLESGAQLAELYDPEDRGDSTKSGAAFFPDGSRIVVGNKGGRIALFDAEGRFIKARRSQSGGEIRDIVVAEAGVLVGEVFGSITLWDKELTRAIRSFSPGAAVRRMALLPKERGFVATSSLGLTAWSFSGTRLFASGVPEGLRGFVDVDLAPDGSSLAVSSTGGEALIYDLDGRLLKRFKAMGANRAYDQLRSLRFSADGARLFCAGDDFFLRSFGLDGRALAVSQPRQSWIHSLAIVPKSGRLVTGGNAGQLALWRPEDLRAIWPKDRPCVGNFQLARSPSGAYFATSSPIGFTMLRARGGAELGRIPLRASALAITSDERLVIGQDNGQLRSFSLPDLKAIQFINLGAAVLRIAEVYEAGRVVVRTRDGRENILNKRTGEVETRIPIADPFRWAQLDGTALGVIANRGGIEVMQLNGSQDLFATYASRDEPIRFATNSGSRSFAALGRGGSITRYSLDSSRPPERLRGAGSRPTLLVISPEGAVAAAERSGALWIWPPGRRQAERLDLRPCGDAPSGLVFDKERLLVAVDRGLILVFERSE